MRVKILNRNGLIEESTSGKHRWIFPPKMKIHFQEIRRINFFLNHYNYGGKLRVGQIIKIDNNEVIPADIVILSTSSNKGSNKIKNVITNILGVCFVNTSSIDGEITTI